MSNPSKEHINESMNAHVADPINIPTAAQVGNLLLVNNTTFYTEADAFAGDPDGLLGSVMQVRYVPKDGDIPASNALEFCPTKISGTLVREGSHLKEPIKRQSILVDRSLALEVNFLNYLKAEIDAQSTFNLLVFDQAAGQADRDRSEWAEGIKTWKADNADILNDANIIRVFVVIGYVQKYVIRKRFNKFNAKASGSVYGVNVKGELFTSTEDYSLDIRYGLTVAPLKTEAAPKVIGLAPTKQREYPSADDIRLLQEFEMIAPARG